MGPIGRMDRGEFESKLKASLVAADLVSDTQQTGELPYTYELDDLHHLYCLVRDTAAVSVLEFGFGWSTLALALAVYENRLTMFYTYSVRHPNPFSVMTVEASEHSRTSVHVQELAFDLSSPLHDHLSY